jgi:hypothetical protein
LFNYSTLGPFTDTVYPQGEPGVNITGIETKDCKVLFGNAAEATENDGYCTCGNVTIAFHLNNKCCKFLIFFGC